MTYELFIHQKDAVEHAKTNNKFVVLASLGSGKTVTLIEIAKSKGAPALFIVTKATKQKWIKALNDFDCDGVVYTKEEFKKHAREFGKIGGYKTICYDEFQSVGNHRSLLTKALLKYISFYEPPYIFGATATLYTSTWECLYSYNLIFGRKLDWFKLRGTICEQVRMGSLMIWRQKKDEETKLFIQNMIADISHISVIETGIPNMKYVDINCRYTKPSEDDTWHTSYKLENTKSEKLAYMRDYIVKGTIICCYYTDEVEYLKDHYKCPAISGAYPYLLEYEDVDKYPVIVMQVSTSVGFELPNHHRMIFYSYTHSYISYTQAMGRISRITNIKDNEYIHLVNAYDNRANKSFKPTFDQGVIESLKNKEDFDPDKFYKNYKLNK